MLEKKPPAAPASYLHHSKRSNAHLVLVANDELRGVLRNWLRCAIHTGSVDELGNTMLALLSKYECVRTRCLCVLEVDGCPVVSESYGWGGMSSQYKVRQAEKHPASVDQRRRHLHLPPPPPQHLCWPPSGVFFCECENLSYQHHRAKLVMHQHNVITTSHHHTSGGEEQAWQPLWCLR